MFLTREIKATARGRDASALSFSLSLSRRPQHFLISISLSLSLSPSRNAERRALLLFKTHLSLPSLSFVFSLRIASHAATTGQGRGQKFLPNCAHTRSSPRVQTQSLGHPVQTSSTRGRERENGCVKCFSAATGNPPGNLPPPFSRTFPFWLSPSDVIIGRGAIFGPHPTHSPRSLSLSEEKGEEGRLSTYVDCS